jgi:hypothetical protein
MTPGTKPPPSIRTFFQVYGSEGAAAAGVALVATCATTAAAPAATMIARALAIPRRVGTVRMCGFSLWGWRGASTGAVRCREAARLPVFSPGLPHRIRADIHTSVSVVSIV